MAQVSVEVPGRARRRACARRFCSSTARRSRRCIWRCAAQAEAGASLEEVRRGRGAADAARRRCSAGSAGRASRGAATVGLAGRRTSCATSCYGSLIDAGERLAVACDGGWRGEASADSVRSAAREVIALDRLLRELEGTA